MKKIIILVLCLTIPLIQACRVNEKIIVPLSSEVLLDDTYTIIWNGISKAYRYEAGNWVRAESYDYQFSVVQKRYNKYWKSVKSMQRIHPGYDGKAGLRNQTMYFEVSYDSLKNGLLPSVIRSSLGAGRGNSDTEFRESCLDIQLEDTSPFIPYNRLRITQHYQYEKGLLTETVELYLEKDGQEIPFMKNEETALFFIKGKLDKAPIISERR